MLSPLLANCGADAGSSSDGTGAAHCLSGGRRWAGHRKLVHQLEARLTGQMTRDCSGNTHGVGAPNYAVRCVTASVLMVPSAKPLFRWGTHALILEALSVRSYVMGVWVGCGQCLAGVMPARLQCPHDALQPATTLRTQTASELASITPQYPPIPAARVLVVGTESPALFSCAGAHPPILVPFSSCCTEIAGQKRNIVNVLPSSLGSAGPVRKSPHQSLPPISPPGLPKAEPYLLDFAAARWTVQKLPNPRLRSSALPDTPFTALVQHPSLCRVHSVPTYRTVPAQSSCRDSRRGLSRRHASPVAVTWPSPAPSLGAERGQ